MSASQISFSEFALAALQVATPRTPPVIDTAVAVVAHPLAVDGGECLKFAGSFVPCRGAGYFDIRADFWSDGIAADWAHCGMDAPSFLPLGGHSAFDLGQCGVKSDGFAGAR